MLDGDPPLCHLIHLHTPRSIPLGRNVQLLQVLSRGSCYRLVFAFWTLMLVSARFSLCLGR